jgi:hypothetical protein
MPAPAPGPGQQLLADLHTRFLELLPRIELHGRIVFRSLKCHQREEAVAEMVALAWKWFARLATRGKDAGDFVVTFCRFAGFAVHNGRRLVRRESPKDVLSAQAQHRKGFKVESLPQAAAASHERLYSLPHGQAMHDAFEERLQDNTLTPVPDQAGAIR